MKFVIYLTVIVALHSCIKMDSQEISSKEQLVFITKMSVSDRDYGTFYSKKDKTEYIYMSNVSTEKKIKIYEKNDSIPKHIIDLREVLKIEKNGIENINIISIDTILLLGKYSNNMYFLNRRGEVWKRIQLDNILKYNKKYELSSSVRNDFVVKDNSILLSPSWNYTNDTIEENFGDIEYVKLHKKNRWDSPYFMKISNIWGGNIKSETGYNLYQQQFPDNPYSHFIEFNNYFVHDDYIYVSSIYSNKITKLNIKNFEVVDEFVITSDYTTIGIPLIPVGSEIRNYEQEYIDYFYSKGYVRKMFYNEATEYFYFNVCIENNDNKTNRSEASRDWLIIIYDKDHNKITEDKIDNNVFYNNFLNTQDGVYIQEKRKINYKEQKVVFKKLDIPSTTRKTKPYDKIKNYFLQNNMKLETVESILVLTNQGTCMNCNNIFAKTIESFINKPNTIIIVTAEGNFIDISPFLEAENVILDFENEFSQLALTNGTSAIFLGNEKIDTILNIEARLLEKQLTFLQKHIKE